MDVLENIVRQVIGNDEIINKSFTIKDETRINWGDSKPTEVVTAEYVIVTKDFCVYESFNNIKYNEDAFNKIFKIKYWGLLRYHAEDNEVRKISFPWADYQLPSGKDNIPLPGVPEKVKMSHTANTISYVQDEEVKEWMNNNGLGLGKACLLKVQNQYLHCHPYLMPLDKFLESLQDLKETVKKENITYGIKRPIEGIVYSDTQLLKIMLSLTQELQVSQK
jgi:hypothetical protein